MSGAGSIAEQCRSHRAAFELALELKCTPREAAKILRDRERARRRACGTRAPGPINDTDIEPLSGPEPSFEDFDCRWMLRD